MTRPSFRRTIAVATSLCLLAPGAALALARPDTTPGLAGGQVTAEGFDKCVAPPSSAMRSWLASPYRVVNIYFGGNNRACASQPELSAQWLTTVTSNGWSVIPTYVGSQARCSTSTKTHKITASTAAEQGTAEADDAAAAMAALGLSPNSGNPIYFDMEPYRVGSDYKTCDNAVLTFFDAWSRELHVQGYVAGIYGTTNTVMKQLVKRRDDPTFQQPDAIWFANWDGNAATTGYTAIPDDMWVGHRIHQYRGGHNETFNGITFNIDSDAVAGDVVAAVTPTAPSGPPYHYAAAPPAGGTLKERTTPETTPDNKTGVVYETGADLSIVCQTVGEDEDGSVVWDQLSDGAYVSDIFTTTTGGLSFTSGIPRCGTETDTTPPTATTGVLPHATLAAEQPITWSGSDDSSGVASYDVRYQRAPYDGAFHHWRHPAELTDTTQTSGTLLLAPGFDYCVETRATDVAGNVGAWSAPQCVARALDDRPLTAGPAWRRLTGSAYYLDTATSTHSQGVTMHLHDAQVARIGVVVTMCPRCGSIEVRVGKRVRTRSLQSEQRVQQQLLMFRAFSLRTRTIHVEATSNGALVRIDGVVASRT